MTKSELNRRYFEWMYQLVNNDENFKYMSYYKLLERLHDIEFVYILDMDGNRAEDGIELRYRFGYEHKYDDSMIATYLDYRACSILEMMIALAMRCEENIMNDPEIGNRTGFWFWNMIVTLGLGTMSDDKFDSEKVNEVIFRFLNREYSIKGEGGLFYVNRPPKDLRSVEIWYQMFWYLNEEFK